MPRPITAKLRSAFSVLAIGSCLMAFGCRKGVETIWTGKAKSPDGQWVAKAQTDQRSGFGTDGATTAVYLQPSNGARSAVQVLSFSQNQNAQTSLIDLKMNWTDGTHLKVSYKAHPNLDFQAVKYAGIDISVQDLSSQAANSSH
jgi:hypothetical protein